MKTTHWILLGAAAVAAYLIWQKYQKQEPLKVEDIGETSEFSGGAKKKMTVSRSRNQSMKK